MMLLTYASLFESWNGAYFLHCDTYAFLPSLLLNFWMHVSILLCFCYKKSCCFVVDRQQPTMWRAVNVNVVICRMPQFEILLINTRIPRSTRQLVENVRQKHSTVWEDVVIAIMYSCYHCDRHYSQCILFSLRNLIAKSFQYAYSFYNIVSRIFHFLVCCGISDRLNDRQSMPWFIYFPCLASEDLFFGWSCFQRGSWWSSWCWEISDLPGERGRGIEKSPMPTL